MEIEKYAYFLDSENKIYENKIFIDLMWYIAKNKDNGESKPKGMVTIDKNGKAVLSAKSYVIRNAGILFQHLFDWHFYYIKKGESTKYQYNDNGKMVNVVYKNFEDWWDEVRLTEVEITSANKFLIETGLITIRKMRIKTILNKDTSEQREVFKPTNCYAINWELTQKYLDILVDISKEVYKQKVDAVREKNIKTSSKAKEKKLSTENTVTLETQVTLKIDGLQDINNDLSTLSTISTDDENTVTLETGVTKDTLETGVTKDTFETGVTKDTFETGVTNNTLSTNTLYSHSLLDREKDPSSLSVSKIWEDIQRELSKSLSEVSFNTWIKTLKVNSLNNETLSVVAPNEFTKGIIASRYADVIKATLIAKERCIKHIEVIDISDIDGKDLADD